MTNQNAQDEVKHVFQVANDGTIDIRRVPKGQVTTELPPAVFSLQFDPDRGLYLRPENDYKIPGRIYGDVDAHVDHFLLSYELNDKNLGVALIGDAGSGKTLKLKRLIMKAKDMGMPTILINSGFAGDGFVGFINSIMQQCVIAFDEFDKTYSVQNEEGRINASTAQNSILQLLDGVASSTKKLFVFTLNEEQFVSPYMKDRPSRIRYRVAHKRLELDTVVEYVTENLQGCTDEHLHAFTHMALSSATYYDGQTRAAGLNFDSMRELVTEMNQFKTSLTECLKMMSPAGVKSTALFEVTIYEDSNQDGNMQKLYTTVATGYFDGPYLGKDKYDLGLSLRKPSTDEKYDFDYEREELTYADFVGFGETPRVAEFRKGNRRFICQYTTGSAFNELSEEIAEDRGEEAVRPLGYYQSNSVIPDKKRPKVNPEMPKKVQNSSLSGAHGAGAVPHSFLSSKHHLDPAAGRLTDDHGSGRVVLRIDPAHTPNNLPTNPGPADNVYKDPRDGNQESNLPY